MNQTALDDFVGSAIGDVFPVEYDAPLLLFQNIRNGVQRRRLSGSVRSYKRDDFFVFNRKGNIVKRFDCAV